MKTTPRMLNYEEWMDASWSRRAKHHKMKELDFFMKFWDKSKHDSSENYKDYLDWYKQYYSKLAQVLA